MENEDKDFLEGYGSPESIERKARKDVLNKISFYKEKNIKVKFRLLARPEYQFIGMIKEITGDFFIIELEKDLAIFEFKEIDLSTICPASCDPFTVYHREPINESLKEEIFERDNHQCQYNFDKDCLKNKGLSIDHIIPVSKGGTNEKNNLVTSCMVCNSKKSNKYLHETIQELNERKKKTIMNRINFLKQ